MNYAQLVTTVQDYCEQTFATADMNTFIDQAEQRIYNSVQLPMLRRNVTGNATAANKYLSAPSDWLATYSMAVVNAAGDYEYMLNKDVNYIREAYPLANDLGKPIYYALFDQNTFILGPTPDANYLIELHYFYYPESIVTNGTSWLGDNFDSALLYGTLLEAYTYLKGEQDVISVYKQRYDEAMMMLKQLGDGKDRRDAYRSGQVRYPVQ
jgi:hypothetical protein